MDINASIKHMKQSFDDFLRKVDIARRYKESERIKEEKNLVSEMIYTLGGEETVYRSNIRQLCSSIKNNKEQGLPIDVLKDTLVNITFAYVAVTEASADLENARSISPLNTQSLILSRDLFANAEREICGTTRHPIRNAVNGFLANHSVFSDHVTDEEYEKRRRIARKMVEMLIAGGDIDSSLKAARLSVENEPEEESNEDIDRQLHSQGKFLKSNTATDNTTDANDAAAVESMLRGMDSSTDDKSIDPTMFIGQTNPNVPD